jgi:hypothetical protein
VGGASAAPPTGSFKAGRFIILKILDEIVIKNQNK